MQWYPKRIKKQTNKKKKGARFMTSKTHHLALRVSIRDKCQAKIVHTALTAHRADCNNMHQNH